MRDHTRKAPRMAWAEGEIEFGPVDQEARKHAEFLDAITKGESYPHPDWPDTPANARLYTRMAQKAVNLAAEGITPDVYNTVPTEDPT